jgi:hypothetical protein
MGPAAAFILAFDERSAGPRPGCTMALLPPGRRPALQCDDAMENCHRVADLAYTVLF